MTKICNYQGEALTFHSGMYSGSRTTMRDNTLLSYCYIRLMEKHLTRLFQNNTRC